MHAHAQNKEEKAKKQHKPRETPDLKPQNTTKQQKELEKKEKRVKTQQQGSRKQATEQTAEKQATSNQATKILLLTNHKMNTIEKAKLDMRAETQSIRRMLRTPTGTKEEENEKRKERTRGHRDFIRKIRKGKYKTDEATAKARNSKR